jgi:hypothetical protein
MSYQRISTGLHNLLAAVSGVKIVVETEPTSIPDTPLIYSVLESESPAGDDVVIVTTWRTKHSLVLPWQDVTEAEDTARDWLDAISAAFLANRTLSGYCRHCDMVDGDLEWQTINGIEFRVVNFYSEALDVSVQIR